MKKLMSLMAIFVVSVLMVSMVSALDDTNVKFHKVEVNNVDIEKTTFLSVEEGEELDIDVVLLAGAAGATDVQVEVEIGGYEYDDYENLEKETEVFNVLPGRTKSVSLTLNLPKGLDKDEYWLRVRVMDKKTTTQETVVRLSVEPTRHGVDIKDVALSPGAKVQAGRSLLASVLLENFGDKHEDDVKVTVAIPALGVSATEFVDAVKMDDKNGLNNIDYEDVPEMFLSIPGNAAAGTYKLDVTVQYDDLRETVSKSFNVEVVENALFQTSDKLVLAVGPVAKTVAQGTTTNFGVALINEGTSSKAYTVEAVSGNGVTATVSESLVVLSPKQSKVVAVGVTPSASAAIGENLVSVTIKSGSESVETVSLKANVVPGQSNDSFNLRNGLEIALIVLVVLLVIIGLIVGFSRLRRDDEEEEQTYY